MTLSPPGRRIVAGFVLAAFGVTAACAAPRWDSPSVERVARAEASLDGDTSPIELSTQADWERRYRHLRSRTEAEKTADEDAPVYEIAVGASRYIWDEMSLGRLHGERMDRSARLDVAFRYHPAPGLEYDPVVGVYGYYEEREWDEGAAEIDYRSFGLGADLGMSVWPRGRPEKGDRGFKLSWVPYARLGIGVQDGEFENIPQETGAFSSGDFDDLRGEARFGFDLRLHLGLRLGISAGLGADIWGSLPQDAVTRNSTGGIIDEDDDLGAWGWGVLGKLGLCVNF